MNRTLGPRDVGDILRETFIIYKNNFWRLAAIVSIAAVPGAVVGLIGEATTGSLEKIIVSIPLYLVVLIISVFTGGAAIHAIAEQYFNRPISIGRAFSFTWRRLGVILGAFSLVLLATFGLAITIIGIPATIYFLITWTFVLPIALLESCGPKDALSHSAVLVKQSWWRVLGILLLLGIIVWAISAILSIPVVIGMMAQALTGAMTGAITEATTLLPTWLLISATIVTLIANVIGIPIFTIGETLLYFDLRVRKEGYNLDALAYELGLTSAPVAAGSIPPV